MPYVDSQIPIESHKEDCPNPTAKRLYIRNYDKNGKQRFIAWGLTCENCHVVLQESHYERNLTKKQQDKQMSMPKLPFKVLGGDTTSSIISEKLSKEEIERRSVKWLKEKKIKQRERERLQTSVMSSKEEKFHDKIRALNLMYENDFERYPNLKKMINWDTKLIERFLSVRPTFPEINEILAWPPLYRNNNRTANRRRGMIPTEKWGFLKGDPGFIHGSNILGEYEKIIVEECKGRQDAMEYIIKKHHASEIKISYTISAPIEKKKKKKNF